ncbi:MAG: hypothetical protein K2M60_02655 [Lachnospiraceae bacterium]|nr:hypothetical protein [Lachnospiraceae bacterium]
MTLLEKYQKFLVNSFRPEVQPLHLNLTAEGWKMLIRENLTPIIEDKLQMKQINDYIWADAYQNGKRRVLSFFLLNDASATFKWGWNFDFIPKKYSGGKMVWARTDKSIYTHIYEVSPDFYNSELIGKCTARDKIIMSRHSVDIKNLEKGLEDKITHHKEVFYHLLPLMKEYYCSTDSYEQLLKRIDYDMENSYYRFIGAVSLLPKAFIEKRMGLQEKAMQDFEEIEFRNEKIKNTYLKKFLSLEEVL